MKIKSTLPKYFLIKLIIFFIVILFLLLFEGIGKSTDRQVESAFSLLRGELSPDTNIVIIHITENDIDKIGPWPIKRSYYALLINNLTNQNVKKIGLEIFLSAKFITQTLYDKLLAKEIEKSHRTVLSSVAGNVFKTIDGYVSDSLSYPSPKLLDDDIITGHLNYLSENGIEVPISIEGINSIEKAFSYQLLKNKEKFKNKKSIKINFISSWKKFKNYSWLEYFKLLQNNDASLQNLKDKIVIIGISDPQFSFPIKTTFDDHLPGAALHAFALDNMMNNRFLNNSFINYSKIFFPITLLILIWYHKGKTKIRMIQHYAVALASSLIPAFILFSYYNLQLAYSWFIIPLLILFAADLSSLLIEKKKVFQVAIDETSILKSHLNKKELELEKFQKELNFTGGSSDSIINKIRSLKSEIEKLKLKERDEVKAEEKNEDKVRNFYGIIYRSKAIDKVADLIGKTAPEEANILIVGESGTGKELAARAVHILSKRKNNNFVAVNCGALSDSLLESELFGHVKGAFTGAAAEKIGRFEAADNGTIFLDEIAETSENFQVKLLRVIQAGEFEKVGSSKTNKVDIRIVAATNKNLESAVKEKKFREDLYYRLNVIKIELPPLRERKEDIEILAQHFLHKESSAISLSKAALEILNEYEWKGNVRELEGVIKRAAIFAKSAGRELIQLADLPDELVKEIKFNFEDLVLESLREKQFSHSSITETASELGNVSRTIVSENFRGLAFKAFVKTNFDIEGTVKILSNTDDNEVNKKVKNKVLTFINNIKSDIQKINDKHFEIVKEKFGSKYKNLPQKFHYYLDEVIKKFL
ncbi:MAG: sigma 54-interacting transcriptional regulator [Ignavibacteriaceae bacterium]